MERTVIELSRGVYLYTNSGTGTAFILIGSNESVNQCVGRSEELNLACIPLHLVCANYKMRSERVSLFG